MASNHKVEQALRTNHFNVFVPDRPDLVQFQHHARYIDITEHAGAGAEVVVGIIHPVNHPELPRAIKEGRVAFIQVELFADKMHEEKIYTMQFEDCSLVKVHRRFDYIVNEPVIVEYTFHAKQVDVMILNETDDVDRSNWSDSPDLSERYRDDERLIPHQPTRQTRRTRRP